MKPELKTLIIFLSILFIFSSCKKKKDNPVEEPPIPTGTIGFHMHITINDEEVDSGAVTTNTLNNQKMRLDLAKFYLSNITAYKTDGTAVPVKDKVLLIHMGEEEYVIGDLPTGNYQSISFQLGLDQTTNKTDAASQTGVLSKENNMWFGSTDKGYIFLNVAGGMDTSANHSGKTDQTFAYQFGSNAYLRTVTMPSMASVGLSPVAVSPDNTAGLPAQFHMLCDFGALLQTIKNKTKNPVATPFNSDSLDVKALLNNLPAAFRYEQ
jgi:hypothetical protein